MSRKQAKINKKKFYFQVSTLRSLLLSLFVQQAANVQAKKQRQTTSELKKTFINI